MPGLELLQLCFFSPCSTFNIPLGVKRKSKDLITNFQGRRMEEVLTEMNLTTLNGMMKSDLLGEVTFVNKMGSSLIDYCCISNFPVPPVVDFVVDPLFANDHFSITCSVLTAQSNRRIPSNQVFI